MQFFKFVGVIANEKCPEDNESRPSWREKARKIGMKTNTFNQKLQKKTFFFVEDASEDTITIGIFTKDSDSLNKQLTSFLKVLGLVLRDTELEEITLDTAFNLLQSASRSDYIEDSDDVLSQFNLNSLCGRRYRNIDYGENLIEIGNKKSVYGKAEHFFGKDSFLPELDRIYAGNVKKKALGHPVHYMVETDDHDTRKGMYRLLLQALHENRRLRSKRYVFLDIKPDEDFSMSVYDCLYQSCIGGAIVIRFLYNVDTEDDRLTCGREMIENMCEIMKKYHNQVLTVFCFPRECTKTKEIFYESLTNISFVDLKEEFVSGERAEQFLKMLARENGVKTDKKLFTKLEADKGYLAPELHELFDSWYNNKLKTSIYPQYKEIVAAKKEIVKAAPKGSSYDELMEMIGLTEAKKVIQKALNYYKAQIIFAEKGMHVDRPSMHMVFTGNPGTAKTSVARLFARIMKENNLLSKGNLIEVGRGDLVGKFVGWTAPTIQKKFREAEGSVLFIDEAYSLVDDCNGSFGDEAINTIVQEMENHRDDVVVIFAGYPDKMEYFLQKNPGLRSRIAFHVPFADYNTEELCQIANLIAKKKGLNLTEDANQKLGKLFEQAKTENDFGNGRYVRNIIEKAKMAQAERLISMDYDTIQTNDVITICADDVEIPTSTQKHPKRQIGFGT